MCSHLTFAQAFAAAVQANFGNYVRLSIHPSSGSTKFSISLFPHTSHNMTPWHATTVYGLDGSVATVHLDMLKASSHHELVCKDGVAWYYRERSTLYDWGNMAVYFEPLYPTGLIVTPVIGFAVPSLKDVDMEKIHRLAEYNSPVVLRGFADTEKEVIVSKAGKIGEIRQGEDIISHDSSKYVWPPSFARNPIYFFTNVSLGCKSSLPPHKIKLLLYFRLPGSSLSTSRTRSTSELFPIALSVPIPTIQIGLT